MHVPQSGGVHVVLSDYVEEALGEAVYDKLQEEALGEAVYDKLQDGAFGGRIPSCPGVIAFGATLRECEDTLRSTLEDWLLVGLKLGHTLPVLAGIDLNGEPRRATMDAV